MYIYFQTYKIYDECGVLLWKHATKIISAEHNFVCQWNWGMYYHS